MTAVKPPSDPALNAVRAFLADAHQALGLAFGFELWDGSTVPASLPAATLRIAIGDAGVLAALLKRGRLTAVVEAYTAGRLDIRNGTLFDLAALRPQGRPSQLLRHISKIKALRAATALWFTRAPVLPKQGLAGNDGESARDGAPETNAANVSHHYDVSNAFYRLFLDERMVYTCGYFTQWHDDLDRAQRDKLDIICRKLRLQPGERYLDIGCGWGALICHAAEYYGIEAHGVTLSKEQLALAQETIAQRGLQGRVFLHLKDYAQMEGTFDKISSIGMFEHVGLANHARYFQTVHSLLRPQGLYLHHTIARRAKKTKRAFAKLRPEAKALTQYIFPGGELDHLGLSITNLERFGFEVRDVEAWREHYQRTTRLWFERLTANKALAEQEVGSAKTRLWLLYLAGCSLAFERGALGVNQTLVSKRTRGPSGLPPTRADWYAERADA